MLIWCVGDFGIIFLLQTLAKLTTGQRKKLRANRDVSSGCSERGGAGGVAKSASSKVIASFTRQGGNSKTSRLADFDATWMWVNNPSE